MTTTHSLDSFYHTHSTRDSTTREHNLKASRSNEDKEIVNGNDYAKKLLVIINWQAGVGVKWGNGNNISNITPTGSRQTCQRESERQCQKYFYFNTQQILSMTSSGLYQGQHVLQQEKNPKKYIAEKLNWWNLGEMVTGFWHTDQDLMDHLYLSRIISHKFWFQLTRKMQWQ